MYDILTDVWYQKTMPQNLFATAVSGEIALTPIDEVEAPYISGTANGATSRRLTDTTQSMVNDQYRNYQIRLTGGTGAGQRRRITSNIDRTFEVDSKWTITPDATTTYEVWPNTDYIYFVGNSQSATFAYDVESDVWVTGPSGDASMTTSTAVTKVGDIPLGLSAGSDNGTGSVLTGCCKRSRFRVCS